MTHAIVEIVIGLCLWMVVPGWITQGKKKTRDTIKLICNIVGVLLVLLGAISLVKCFLPV